MKGGVGNRQVLSSELLGRSLCHDPLCSGILRTILSSSPQERVSCHHGYLGDWSLTPISYIVFTPSPVV